MGYSSSFSWRSVWSSKALVKEGTIWRVGNGLEINIWKDPLLTDEQGSFIMSTEVDKVSTVSDLIDRSNIEWKEEVISEFFNERDKRCIMELPLSWRAPEDELTWAYSKDGNYAVKTAYMLGKGCDFAAFHLAWVEIWGMDVVPKARHFLW